MNGASVFSRRRWLWFALLLIAGVCRRLPYAASRPIVTEDETLYSLPTVQRMAAGERLFYIAGPNYGAPLQDALAVPLVRQWGEAPWTLRLPVVLLGALGAALTFLTLR